MKSRNLEQKLGDPSMQETDVKQTRLVTAALPYINNIPHLGHIVGSHLPADIFARFCRMRGYDTVFIGGTDENGSTSEIAAEKIGVDIQNFADKLHVAHKSIYDWFNISYDTFSRTTNRLHHQTVQDFFKIVNANGFVTLGKMKVFYSPGEDRYLPDRYIRGTCPHCGYKDANGDQCEKCTKVINPTQLVDPKSAQTGGSVEIKDVDHLFLRLDKLSPKLEAWIKQQKNWRQQVTALAMGWIHDGLKERCITRDLKHGVPVNLKGFEKKVFYVWFDAPIAYLSFTKEARPADWEKIWASDSSRIYNFLGKDNIPFHTIFWPGMILAHGDLNLPHNVVGLQYLNYEGGKFSKSQKRGVFCEKLPESGIEPDLMRGYLTTIIPETGDAEFKWEEFQRRINSDVIGNYGNLVNRTISFINARLGGVVERPAEYELTDSDKRLMETIKQKSAKITDLLEAAEIREAFSEVLALSTAGNKYFEENKPWEILKIDKKKAENILYHCAELCRSLSVMASPFLPNSSQKVWEQLKMQGKVDTAGNWSSASEVRACEKYAPKEAKVLFGKLTDEYITRFRKTVEDTSDIAELFKK